MWLFLKQAKTDQTTEPLQIRSSMEEDILGGTLPPDSLVHELHFEVTSRQPIKVDLGSVFSSVTSSKRKKKEKKKTTKDKKITKKSYRVDSSVSTVVHERL